jgi:hypothetical protein
VNKILKIEEIENMELRPMHNGQPGMKGMLNALLGVGGYDGYKVETEQGDLFILIDNGQCCCESWGYFSTEDELQNFIGADLLDIELTDTALTTESIEELECLDNGGVQFVTFKTDKGVFQLAVYNAHNGYYGHGIYVFKNDECLLNSVL